mgnify:CR=1 FL=1
MYWLKDMLQRACKSSAIGLQQHSSCFLKAVLLQADNTAFRKRLHYSCRHKKSRTELMSGSFVSILNVLALSLLSQ